MRRIISLLLALSCILSVTMVSFADDSKTVDVNYTVETEYEWTVPAGITFTSNTNGASDEQVGTVAVTKNVIPTNGELRIDIDTSETFLLYEVSTAAGSAREYTVSKTSGGAALGAGSRVLTVTAGTNTGSQDLYFNLTPVEVEKSGTYAGTCNFTATVYVDRKHTGGSN